MKPRVFFRADGDSKVGLGHVIRSLALLDMIKDYFNCTFIINLPSEKLKQLLKEKAHQLHIISESTALKKEAIKLVNDVFLPNDIVILDGYKFDYEYQLILKDAHIHLISIDDVHNTHFVSDLVINHNQGALVSDYNTEIYTNLLLGLDYALLRKPFLEASRNKLKDIKSFDGIFICLGGADPNNDLEKVLKKINTTLHKLYIIIGSAYKFKDAIEIYLSTSDLSYRIYQNIDASKMVEIMMKCPIAITSPSTIAHEYLSVGGTLYLYKIADNQNRVFEYYTSNEIAYSFEEYGNEKHALKKCKHFDGKQDSRLLRAINELLISYKVANNEDHLTLTHLWINDPETRKNSFSPDEIPLYSHSNWLKKVLSNPDHYYLIAYYNKEPLGQVRFFIEKEWATINYLISPEYRGRKLAAPMIKLAIDELFTKNHHLLGVTGLVKIDNIPSIKVFESLNFQKSKAVKYKSTYKFTLVNE